MIRMHCRVPFQRRQRRCFALRDGQRDDEAAETYREGRCGLAAVEHAYWPLEASRHGPSIRPRRRRPAAGGAPSTPDPVCTQLHSRPRPMRRLSCRALQPIRPHRRRHCRLQHRPPALPPAVFAIRSRVPTPARASASRAICHPIPIPGVHHADPNGFATSLLPPKLRLYGGLVHMCMAPLDAARAHVEFASPGTRPDQ